MFFKKRETEIDDDFEYDDFDDFDLDDAGFQDATPKSGPRKAVSEIAGGFFSGLKSSVLDPSFHRKVLKESLPDGYVSHYDDASTILGEAKSIYNTASEEARKIKEEYAKEIRPAVDNWNKKSNSKLSNKISSIIGQPQSEPGYSNTLSPEEAEYHNSANDIFSGVFAQSTSEGVNELTAQTREGNEVSKGLQQQTNTILTGVSNSLNQQNAFSEQVALKWKKKTLEIQFKQYFTARKQLEVQNQSLDYLKATIPNIVKNTALPDMVKVQTTELAGQMLAQKWIGGISDKAHESLAGAFGKIGTNIKQTIQDKSQLVLGSAGTAGSFFNMFNGEDEFSQTPGQMALNMIGGFGANQLVDTIFDKSKDTIRDKIDGTGVDFDKSNESLKNLKLTLPALMSNLAQNGSGNDALDKLIEIAGIDTIYAPRSKTIQTAITGDALADQAVFNIETQKSITYTIPALLSEIHGELSSVRFAVGGTTPDDGDKLAMDWTSSRLNTRSRMKVNLGDRLYTKSDADKALEVVYKMLGKFGYDAKKIRDEGRLLSEDGKTVLLSKKDLNNLAVAIKTASYDRTKFFNIESLAEGSELIRDVESRMNIARFFQQELNVDDRDEDLSASINLIGDKKAYLERKSTEKLKQQNILEEARIDAAADGIPESQIRRAVQEGQVHDLVAQGIVTLDDKGNYKIDPQALAEQTMFAEHKGKRTTDEMFGIKINNEYGILERDQQERERMRILEEREQQKRDEEEKRKKAEKEKFDNMTASEKAAHIFKEGKANLKRTKEDILNAKEFIKGTEATESAEQTAKQTFSEITDVLEEGAGVWAQQFKASVQDSAFAGPKKLPDNFSNLEFKPKPPKDLPPEEVTQEASDEPKRRKGVKIGNFIYGADVKVTRGKRKPAEPPRRKIIDSGLKPEIDRLKRSQSSFTPEQSSEIVSASSVVFTRLMDEAIKKQTQAPYANPGFKPDANFYDGGTITKFSGLIQNFAEGGMVKINTFYNKLVDKFLKTEPVKTYPIFTPVADKPTGFDNVLAPIKTAMDKETAEGGDAQLIVASAGEEVLSTKNGDAQAFRDFKNSGVWAKMKTHKEIFDDFVNNNFLRPDMTVEDAADMWNYNEQLAHPTGPNGTNIYDDFSAHTFKPVSAHTFKPVNIPPEDKSVKELTKSLFSEVKRAAEESTEGLRSDFRSAMEDWRAASAEETDGKTIGSAIKNVLDEVANTKRKFTDKREFTYVEDPSQFDIIGGLVPNQGYQETGLLNGIKTKVGKLKDMDTEEARAKMLGGLLGIKDFGVDKLKAFSSMFESEVGESGGFSKPSFSFSGKGKAINTITHQIKELIRLTSHVALNTGSSLEDITPEDPSLIEPIDATRVKGPGFFSKLKDKFKRKPKEQTTPNPEDTEAEENVSFWTKLKSKFKRNKDEEEEESEDPEEKERGLLRRAIGGLFGLGWKTTKFSGKTSWAITKGVGKGGWWGTKKTTSGIGWVGKGIFGSTKETQDVYLEGERKPVMLAKDMAEGKYLSAEDGTPILKAEDIKGAVLDEKGNFVITEEDWNNRRVVIFTNEGKRSLFVRGVVGGAKLWANSIKLSSKLSWNLAKIPYKLATYEFKDDLDVENPQLNGYIEKDIYVKGDREPIIRAKLVGTGVYWTKDREPVETYSQLKDGVYDSSGNLILGPNEIDKGLYTPDGTLISKAFGFVGSTIGFGASLGFKALKGLTKVYGAGFSLMSGAAKGLWSSLRGESKDFDIDGVDKYALMLQAQAASVDKLEMIRLLLDERIEAPNNSFNDKDKDGVRDGSYMDQIRDKIAAKKKAKEDAKKTKEEKEKEKKDKEERKGMFSGLTDSITSGISGFFSKGLMFAALGGLVAANFGPQIATGIFSGIRSVLPSWLGGYNDEKKAEIKAGGGVIKHMMESGAAAAEDSEGNRINTQPQVDENGNPLPQELDENGNPIPTEGGTGLSTSTKFLLGSAAALNAGTIIKGTGKLAGKGVGLLGKGIKWGANKTGLTAKLGLSGMGKKAAVKHLAIKGGGLLKSGLKGTGGLLKGAGRLLANPVARTAALNGARTAITSALPALASNPIGWAVLGAIAVGVTVYAGYKLYKHLTKEDNHLATFRMAQYGYKMNNKKAVTKILDLEQYLAKYTIKATASTSAKISTQADTKKLFEIFGVNQNSKEESDKLLEWYYYRFKPVYLTWKTLFARAIGKVTIEDVDRLLFISDKLKMIDDADFHREELNPYDVPIAPFSGDSELDYTTREQVLEIRDKAISELGKIDQEKHDAKVKSAGGGSKGISDGVKPIDKMTASDGKSSTTKRKQKEEEKEREREAKEAAKQGMGNNKPEQKEQSWFSKFLFGDKSKTDDTAFGWGAKLGKKFRESVGNFFGGSGGGGTYDASSKTLNLTSQDIEDLTKVTSTEAAAGLPAAEYNRQAAAIVDTIINRAVAKGQKFGKSIREVINAPRQFSKITGPKRLNPYGAVQNMPMSAVDKRAAAFVPQYIQARVAGQQPLVNGDLNYLNPLHSDQSNLRAWGNDIVNQAKKSGQIFGKGQSIHYHGTTKDGQNAKPYGYKLALAGKVSAPQGNTGGSSGTAAKTNTNTTTTAKPTPTQSATNPAPKKTTPPSTQNPVPAAPAKTTTPAPAKNTNPPKDKTKKETATTGIVGWINEKSANIVGGVSKVASVVKDANKAMSGSPNSAPVTKKDGTTVNMTPQQKQAAVAKGEVPAAKPDGNQVAPQMTTAARPAKAAAYATKNARSSSLGLCARYVRLALQHAGYPNMGGGIVSAYMYATTGHLTKNGFKEIPANSAPQLGDVAVIDKNAKTIHGHICIYNGSKWVSDFIHPKPNVYSGVNPKIWLYRDAQFLNGAPAAIDGAFDTGADGTPLENGAPPGPPPYQMKLEKAREELEKRKAKRAELLAKAQAKGYKEEKVKIGFEGGRALGEIKGAKADTSGSGKNKSISEKLGLPKFGKLGESKVITYDNTPSGYEPKVRESKIKEVEDNGAVGNSVGPKRDAETIRAEHAAKETQQLEAAKNEQIRREKAEQQNQEQLKRLEARRQAEVVTANEQKIHIEKQNQIAATDSEIYKQQLDVQISMAKDIRRMAETLDKLYANPSQVLDSKSSTTITKAEPTQVPVEMNQHTRTVATEEPVSMKIR